MRLRKKGARTAFNGEVVLELDRHFVANERFEKRKEKLMNIISAMEGQREHERERAGQTRAERRVYANARSSSLRLGFHARWSKKQIH